MARVYDRDKYQTPPFRTPKRAYTDHASIVYVTGLPSTEYVSDETPMNAYANVHLALEHMRVRALRAVHGSPPSSDDEGDTDANPEPPRVLVLGPENSGKTTVTKILVNYAVRTGQDWTPMLVNADPGEVRKHSP